MKINLHIEISPDAPAPEKASAPKEAVNPRTYIEISLMLFTGTLAGILLVYILRDGAFHFNYSISRYVGREPWSALLFLISNLVVAWYWFKFIQAKKSTYGETFAVFGTMVIITLVALSLCPVGLFDAEWGNYGTVSIIHQISSRWMFGAMAVMVYTMLQSPAFRARRSRFFAGLAFVAYAALCVVLSLTTQIFWDITFLFESAYVYAFILLLLL